MFTVSFETGSKVGQKLEARFCRQFSDVSSPNVSFDFRVSFEAQSQVVKLYDLHYVILGISFEHLTSYISLLYPIFCNGMLTLNPFNRRCTGFYRFQTSYCNVISYQLIRPISLVFFSNEISWVTRWHFTIFSIHNVSSILL